VLLYGDRIGKQGRLVPACDAVIFDATREKVLLTRRSDNGQWCLPGGAMDPGESAPECCAREVLEETGLVVSVGRLIGVYSTPHRITEYPDGNRKQALDLVFEAVRVSGQLAVSDETTEVGYFSPEQMISMEIMELFHERVNDAFASQEAAFLR
jgi:8-oxo-dGTP pyrophosphatase MutT (NUDIX family)